VVRIALNDWLMRMGALRPRESAEDLECHRAARRQVAGLKPAAAAEPSPAIGLAMLRRARAKNDLAKAKDRRAKGAPK